MINGFINLYKPRGMGSNYALRQIKRLLGVRKAGFLGTLDPMAEGVLPIALGEATKTLYYMEGVHKTYIFTVKFGVETDTGDSEGKVVKQNPVVKPQGDEIRKILPKFIGEIMQTPPKFSAVHIEGKRAYALAAAGKDFEIKPRRQQVFSLEYLGDTFRVEVDRGFYIRSLAMDIAAALGTVGHVTFLKREREGTFGEDTSITLDRIKEMVQNTPHSQGARDFSFVLPLPCGLDGIPALSATKAEAAALGQGKNILTEAASGLYQVFCGEKLLAIARASSGMLKPERVFNLQEAKNDR